MSGPVTSVARVEDVQIFLKDPVYIYTHTHTHTHTHKTLENEVESVLISNYLQN